VSDPTPDAGAAKPVDVNAHIGGYPWRHVPHPEPAVLARVLEREGLAGAWVGHLPSAFWRDPAPGNAELYAALAPHPTLHPAPAVRPDWPGWERHVRDAADRGAPALRAYPQLWGLAPGDASLDRLAAACARPGSRSCSARASRTAGSATRSTPRPTCSPRTFALSRARRWARPWWS
jgi:hypothetical protein